MTATITEAIEGLRRDHWVEDGDCWFSCPLAPHPRGEGSACCDDAAVARGVCTCGADAHNAKVDAVLRRLAEQAVPA